ncbi:MAG: hypothetical protein ACR2LU_09180, partial [Luteitalea sp.]
MRRVLLLSLVLGCAPSVGAQTSSGTPPPSSPSSPPRSPSASAGELTRRPPLDRARAAALSARYHVRQRESVLERAVQH